MLNYKKWKLNQVVGGCIITLGGFGNGCALSWTATAFPRLDETGELGVISAWEKSWIASIMAIGAMVGCPVTGLFLKDRGRKGSFIGFSLVALVGWMLLAGATNTTYLYFGRALLGFSSGGYTILIPIYVSEIASKKNRGLIGSLFLLMLSLGRLFSVLVGIFFPVGIASLLCGCHPILFSALLTQIPESPKVLMNLKKEKEAYKALTWYQAEGIKSLFATFETYQSEPNLEANRTFEPVSSVEPDLISSKRKGLFSREYLKPLLTVYILMMLTQFSGINVSTFYTVEIFKMSGDLLIHSELETIILVLIQTIGCIPCSIFVDKYGRKGLLTSSFFFMALAMMALSVFFYAKDFTNLEILTRYPWLGIVPVVSLVIYNLAYAWGVGSLVWVLIPELIPPSIIGSASAIASIIFWGSAFLLLQSFQMLKDRIPLIIWFSAFTLVCAIGCIFSSFLPETKGLSLEEIQKFYQIN